MGECRRVVVAVFPAVDDSKRYQPPRDGAGEQHVERDLDMQLALSRIVVEGTVGVGKQRVQSALHMFPSLGLIHGVSSW